MSAKDPGAMAYPQTYPPRLPKCACGHVAEVHLVEEATKERTSCSSWHGGRCRCRKYEGVADGVA